MSFECVVCGELLTNEEDVYSTRCGHIFHRHCLTEWLRKSSTCPQCRAHTFHNDLRKLFFNYSPGHDQSIRDLRHKNQALTNTVEALRKNQKSDKKLIKDLTDEVDRVTAELEEFQVFLAESKTDHAQIVSDLYVSRQECEESSAIHNSIIDEQDSERKFIIMEMAFLQSTIEQVHQEKQQLGTDLRKEIKDLTERVKVLTEANRVCSVQVNDLSKEKTSLMEKIVKYKDEISCLQKHIDDKQQGTKHLQERIKFLDNENATFSKDIKIVETQKQELSQQVNNLEEERKTFYENLADIEKQKAELADKVKHLEEENKQLSENFGKEVVVSPKKLPKEIEEPEKLGEAESVLESNTDPEDKVVVPNQEISAGDESKEELLIQFDVEEEETTPLKPSPEEYGSSTALELVTPSSGSSSPESNSPACKDSVIVPESSTETEDLLEALDPYSAKGIKYKAEVEE